MTRRLALVALSVALGLGSALPGLHLHLDDHGGLPDSHHDGPTIHAHATTHVIGVRPDCGAGPTVGAYDDAHVAQLVSVMVAARDSRHEPASALVPARAYTQRQDGSHPQQHAVVERVHGPPNDRSASPRAPPA